MRLNRRKVKTIRASRAHKADEQVNTFLEECSEAGVQVHRISHSAVTIGKEIQHIYSIEYDWYSEREKEQIKREQQEQYAAWLQWIREEKPDNVSLTNFKNLVKQSDIERRQLSRTIAPHLGNREGPNRDRWGTFL